MKHLILLLSLMCSMCITAQTYTLQQCRDMASQHNKSLSIAREKVKVANSFKKAAFTQYLPSISASGAYIYTSKDIQLLSDDQQQQLKSVGTKAQGTMSATAQALLASNPALASLLGPLLSQLDIATPINAMGQGVVDAFDLDTKNIWAGAITLTQPIFTGGRIVQANKIAKYTQELEQTKLDNENISTIYSTDEAYWRVVSLVNKYKLAESYVKLLERLDSDVQKSIAIGTSTKADGLSVKVKLNEAQMTQLPVEDGLALSKKALCQIIGLPLNTDIHLEDETVNAILLNQFL